MLLIVLLSYISLNNYCIIVNYSYNYFPTLWHLTDTIINNNNNNRPNQVDIYGAVIMASHCESSPGLFDECRLSAKVAANPQTKPLTWTVNPPKERQLPSTSTIAISLLLSPRADTHFTIPRRVEGWVNLGTAVRVCSPCPRLYIAVAVVINTTACGEIRTWVLSHRNQACYR